MKVDPVTFEATQSPSDIAKAYAAEYGFAITPNGRRYDIYGCDVFLCQVGGYSAALNAMKREIERNQIDAYTEPTIKVSEHVKISSTVTSAPPASAMMGDVVSPESKVRDKSLLAPVYRSTAPKPWKVMQRHNGSDWTPLPVAYNTYHGAITECRRLQNVAALRAIERRVEYRP